MNLGNSPKDFNEIKQIDLARTHFSKIYQKNKPKKPVIQVLANILLVNI